VHHAARRFVRESGILRSYLTTEDGSEDVAEDIDGHHESDGGGVCECEDEEGFGVAGEEDRLWVSKDPSALHHGLHNEDSSIADPRLESWRMPRNGSETGMNRKGQRRRVAFVSDGTCRAIGAKGTCSHILLKRGAKVKQRRMRSQEPEVKPTIRKRHEQHMPLLSFLSTLENAGKMVYEIINERFESFEVVGVVVEREDDEPFDLNGDEMEK